MFTGTLRVKQREHWVSDSGLMCESLTHQRSEPLARVLQRMLHISFISVYLFVLANTSDKLIIDPLQGSTRGKSRSVLMDHLREIITMGHHGEIIL